VAIRDRRVRAARRLGPRLAYRSRAAPNSPPGGSTAPEENNTQPRRKPIRAQAHTLTPAGPITHAPTVEVDILGGLPASRIIGVSIAVPGDRMAA
jgi:hypothetical protein